MSFVNPDGRSSISKLSRPSYAQSFLARVEVASNRPKRSKHEQAAAAPSSGRTGLTPEAQPGRDIKNITFGVQFKRD